MSEKRTPEGAIDAILWIRDHRGDVIHWNTLQSLVDARIAVHPDLANLDDHLDDIERALR